jgi:hypothetical protein
MKSKRLVLVVILLATSHLALSRERKYNSASADSVTIPKPTGIYVLDDPSNEKPANNVYDTSLTSSTAYKNYVTGQAIFIPIAKILPSITTWGVFNWNWSYLDSLVQIAVTNGKKFSIELETGFQSSTTYLQALPDGFINAVGVNGAPLFDVWITGGTGGRPISAYIPLPWIPKVQQFWDSTAYALSAHFHQTNVYNYLTLVHIPGLSVYDEELRLPTGYPSPTPSDTMLCPDGRPAYPTVLTDADTSRWRSLGYSDSAVVNGFSIIVSAYAQAFPDRYLGLSLFPLGTTGIDFPNLTQDTVGYVASQIVNMVNSVAPGRVQIQSDNLDANMILPEVKKLALQYSDLIGWQSNKHSGAGAGCNGGGVGSCNPDSSAGPYFDLLKNGAVNGGTYIEIWSTDVVNYPISISAAISDGYYTGPQISDVEILHPKGPYFVLDQNYPNPFNPSTIIKYELPKESFVTIKLYDLLGREIKTLVNEDKPAGSYSFTFNGSDLSSGVYFYRMQAGDFLQTKKLILLK